NIAVAWPLLLAVGRLLAEECDLAGDVGTLAPQVIGDCAAQAGIPDPMGTVGRHRPIPAGELVRALRAGLDARQLMRNGEVDGLVVADLKVQAGMLLERAPIAAVERVGADKIERPGDGAS